MSVKTVSAMLVLVAATSIVAGCDGAKSKPTAITTHRVMITSPAKPESKDAYRGQMSMIDRELSGVLRTLQTLAATSIVYPAKPRSALIAATTLEKAQTLLRDAAHRLDETTWPTAIESDNVRLAAGARMLDAELESAIKLLKRGVLHTAGSLPTLKGAEQVRRARVVIKERGY